jgi:hypothetical protein
VSKNLKVPPTVNVKTHDELVSRLQGAEGAAEQVVKTIRDLGESGGDSP